MSERDVEEGKAAKIHPVLKDYFSANPSPESMLAVKDYVANAWARWDSVKDITVAPKNDESVGEADEGGA